MHAPIGTYLLLLPCLQSISLAAQPGHLPDLYMMTLFSVGAVLLRSSGCVLNDLWDRKLDSQVERTKDRPIANQQISVNQAVIYLGAQLTLGLGILLQLNQYSQILGASSLILVTTYPLMKRFTYLPQAYLGLTFNWGAMLGYSAVVGACDWNIVAPFYLSSVMWTLVYDTIYAHQDKFDDKKVGIKSTALLFGDQTQKYLSGFAVAQLSLLTLTGVQASMGPIYYAGLVGVASHLGWQLRSVDINNREDCNSKFKSNQYLGLILLLAIAADKLNQKPLEKTEDSQASQQAEVM